MRRADFDAAILDLDGTMVDTLGDFDAAVNAMLAELRLPAMPREAVARGVGWGSEHLIRVALRHAGGGEAQYDEAWASYQRHYLGINGRHSQVFPGVREALGRFSASGLALACVTNKPHAFSTALLEAMGLGPHFSVVFGGDSLPKKKPDPMPLLAACEALGTTPARTLMIGDSQIDAQAGAAAGCPVVLVRYGFHHGQDLGSLGVARVLDRIDELWPV
jgi:phosphoglycolate phosphatase